MIKVILTKFIANIGYSDEGKMKSWMKEKRKERNGKGRLYDPKNAMFMSQKIKFDNKAFSLFARRS